MAIRDQHNPAPKCARRISLWAYVKLAVTYAVLVKCKQEEYAIPLRRATKRFVNAFRPCLAHVDGTGRMHRIISTALDTIQ